MKGEAAGTSEELPVAPLEGDDLAEDEEHLQAAEQFELKHNFRFEVRPAAPCPSAGKKVCSPRVVRAPSVWSLYFGKHACMSAGA